MQLKFLKRDTPASRADLGFRRAPQATGIASEKEKVDPADHFCLTGLAPEGYFAGSPKQLWWQGGCQRNLLWDVCGKRGSTWGRRVDIP